MYVLIAGADAEFTPCDTDFSDVKSDNTNSGAISAAYQRLAILFLTLCLLVKLQPQ